MESYIPRTVSRYGDGNNSQDRQSISLEEYIRFKSQRIILFGDAQCGKTIELKHLTEILEKDLDNIVIEFSLYRYQGGRLLEYIHTMPESVTEGVRLCFLLDGLDEVKEAWKETILYEILELSEKYKTAIIVLTCRINYESSVSLDGFDTLCLDNLDNSFVKSFIELHSKEPKTLYDLMFRHFYGIAWTSPFFLNEVVDYFNSYETLPYDKTIIYERFIQKALTLNNDKKVYSNRLTRSLEESNWETFLCKLAFCMMDSQSLEVSYKDVALVFPSLLKEMGDISSSPLIHIDSEGNLSFIHNSFREFFAAKSLVSLDYKEIKRIVCYLNTDTLIPSWTQPIMFLMSLLSKEKSNTFNLLLPWLLEKNLNDIIRYGGSFIEEKIKNQIFEKLYKSWTGIFSVKPIFLMLFAPSKTNVELVISGLEKGDESLCIYLHYADLSFMNPMEKEHLCSVLLEFARSQAAGRVSYYFFDCVDVRIDCMKTRFALNGIIEIVKKYRNEKLCFTALHLISILGVYDDYSDFILANLGKLFKTDLNLSGFLSILKKDDFAIALQTAIYEDVYKMNIYKSLFEKMATFGKDEIKEFELLIINEIMMIPPSRIAYNNDRFYALRNFFYAVSDRSKLTKEYLGKMRRILIERYQLGDKRYLQEEYDGYSSLLSILVTKDICDKYTGETNETASYDGEIILNCVQENPILNRFLLMYDKWPLHSDILQEAIDALLDKEMMINQVQDILESLKKQDFSSDEDRAARNWMWRYHACCRGARSAFHILLKYRDEWSQQGYSLNTESVPWVEDEEKYFPFVFDYFYKKRQSIRLATIHLSDKQMDTLTTLVKKVIRNPQKYDNYPESLIKKLLHVIFLFEPDLQDEDYVLLIPYLHERIDVYPLYINEEEMVYLIDYVLDHLSDLDSYGSSIKKFLTLDSYHRYKSDIAEICVDRIIDRKIRSLYPFLPTFLMTCNVNCMGYRLYDLFKKLSISSIPYDDLLKNLDVTLFLIASKPIIEKQSGADLNAIHDRLLNISHNSSNDEDIILKANSLLVSFGDNNALRYMCDKHPGYSEASYTWPSFDHCNTSNLNLIKYFYLKTLYKMHSETVTGLHHVLENIQKNLFRLSLDSEEVLNDIMAFFDKLEQKYPKWFDEASLSHEAYLFFLENKSAKRTLSESAKRMEDVFEKK